MRVTDKIKKGINITRPSNVSEEQWNKAMNLYEVAKDRGDKYPELTVAQAVLETGWFKSPSGKFNYFGQKASNSQQGSYKNTQEVSNNSAYSTKAKFRDYDSLTNAVDDRIKKWGSKYEDAATVEDALYSIWEYDAEKGSGVGYATDNKYDEKIKKILGMMGVSMSTKAKSTPTTIQQPTYEYPNPVEETINVAESTKVATPDFNPELEYQNTLLKEQLDTYKAQQQEADKLSVAEQAQYKLDKKVKERDFIKDLILQTGAQFVQPEQTRSVYEG